MSRFGILICKFDKVALQIKSNFVRIQIKL